MAKKDVDTVAWGAVIIGSVIGLVASLVLSVEALTLAANPDAALSCNISIVLNCATVAEHESSQILGFPNSFIGMITLPVMLTIAVAGLAGVKFPRWFIRATWIGAIAGVLFAGWMFYQSYYVIQALCPWCLTTDIAMIFIAFGVFRYAARQKYLCIKPEVLERASRNNYDLVAAISIIVIAAAMIIVKYGDVLFI